MKDKVIVLGGDGFCGWPTSLGLSNAGYDITIVDNLSRRKIDVDIECESLTPIRPISKRISTWMDITKKNIDFKHIDIAIQYNKLLSLINEIKPKAIIHFAEQRSAPFSMRSPYLKRYTVSNNLNATNNVLCAIVESGLDIHLIHLGTTGVYGYGTAGMQIPEGYLKVKVDVNGRDKEMDIIYPPNPGSIYHMTKTQDALTFLYYNKNDKIRITDLHQGIVWGTETEETKLDENLINRFDYDGDYGTVLNRFVMQSAVGHPLTVHGTGGQTRAFINIQDTVNCIKLVVEDPPGQGEPVKIFNQTTECHNILDLAKTISTLTGGKIKYYSNPRNEDEKNDLKFCNDKFLSLGLKPITLKEGLLSEIHNIANKYKDRCDETKIICTSVWNANLPVDTKGSELPVSNTELLNRS